MMLSMAQPNFSFTEIMLNVYKLKGCYYTGFGSSNISHYKNSNSTVHCTPLKQKIRMVISRERRELDQRSKCLERCPKTHIFCRVGGGEVLWVVLGFWEARLTIQVCIFWKWYLFNWFGWTMVTNGYGNVCVMVTCMQMSKTPASYWGAELFRYSAFNLVNKYKSHKLQQLQLFEDQLRHFKIRLFL